MQAAHSVPQDYSEALDWLYSRQLFGIKLGLDAMERLTQALGSPQNSLRFLHVAGTNGKGSVCAMADAILRKHGVRTGLFTSPHLVDFRERIQVNGEKIPHEAVVRGLRKLETIMQSWEPGPTFFELVCALALDWVREEGVDVVVWETGMGGRLDATNIVTPEVSVITSIGMDHQRWLGNTLAEIAGEKAGIIKPGVPVITLPQEPEALAVLRSTSAALASPMQEIEQPWQGPLGLAGAHQRWNAAAAVAASRIIHPGLQKSAVADALARVSWPGRFQRIAPNIILDGAHNPAAASALAATWAENFPGQKAHMIFGALEDKAVAEVLSLLDPICEDIVFVSAPSPRALAPKTLQQLCGRGSCCPDLRQALEVARQADGPILITGSLFLVGEAVALLEGNPTPRPSTQ